MSFLMASSLFKVVSAKTKLFGHASVSLGTYQFLNSTYHICWHSNICKQNNSLMQPDAIKSKKSSNLYNSTMVKNVRLAVASQEISLVCNSFLAWR